VTNLFQPWILLRLASAIVIATLFVRASRTGARVIAHYDVVRSSEGQLALERQLELAATYARVAAIASALDLGLGVLAADRLSHGLRGAMCAYGVFGAVGSLGWLALGASVVLAIAGGLLAQLFAFDASLPRLDLARPLAKTMLVVAPLALVSAALQAAFLLDLDLSASASCCSVEIDSAGASIWGLHGGPRAGVSAAGAIAVLVAAVSMALVARRPSRRALVAVAALAAVAGALGVAAVITGVAPHAFETPQHLCPFCLLRADVHGIGYPLFGAIYLGVVWSLGAAMGGLFAGGRVAALRAFAERRLRWGAIAFAIALVLGAEPVVRYAWVSGGTLLFP